MESLKDKLTEDVLYDIMHKATAVIIGAFPYDVICATDDHVYLDSYGNDVELTYAELLQDIADNDYDVTFYELKEIEI